MISDRRSALLLTPSLPSLTRSLRDDRDHLICDSSDVASYIRFPESEYYPAHRFKRSGMFHVSLSIPSYLSNPVGGIVSLGKFRDTGFEVPPVPEVAIAEHHYTRRGKDDVGSAGQASMAQPVAESAGPKLTTKSQFAERVPFPTCPARRTRGGSRSWV